MFHPSVSSSFAEDLMSLLDADIHSAHPSVIIDADAMFSEDISYFGYPSFRRSSLSRLGSSRGTSPLTCNGVAGCRPGFGDNTGDGFCLWGWCSYTFFFFFLRYMDSILFLSQISFIGSGSKQFKTGHLKAFFVFQTKLFRFSCFFLVGVKTFSSLLHFGFTKITKLSGRNWFTRMKDVLFSCPDVPSLKSVSI